MRIGIECGQSFWRLHSWYCCFSFHEHSKKFFRRFPEGFAFGPVMAIKGKQ